MKKININDSLKDLNLKIGEKVELYGHEWFYDEERRPNHEPIRFLVPVD